MTIQTDIVSGKIMAEITGAKDPKAQIKVLSAARIHYWLDVKGYPVTIKDNLLPQHKTTKTNSKLKLINGP